MSVRARVKLCSGLAKIGWLSKRKFQEIYPKIIKVRLVSNVSVKIKGDLNLEGYDSEKKCYIKAGGKLNVSSSNRFVIYNDSTWTIYFFFKNGVVEIVRGKCGPTGFVGSSWNKSFMESQLLLPTGCGYYYTEELQKAFGLLRNNINVGTYPNCRRWSKD